MLDRTRCKVQGYSSALGTIYLGPGVWEAAGATSEGRIVTPQKQNKRPRTTKYDIGGRLVPLARREARDINPI